MMPRTVPTACGAETQPEEGRRDLGDGPVRQQGEQQRGERLKVGGSVDEDLALPDQVAEPAEAQGRDDEEDEVDEGELEKVILR